MALRPRLSPGVPLSRDRSSLRYSAAQGLSSDERGRLDTGFLGSSREPHRTGQEAQPAAPLPAGVAIATPPRGGNGRPRRLEHSDSNTLDFEHSDVHAEGPVRIDAELGDEQHTCAPTDAPDRQAQAAPSCEHCTPNPRAKGASHKRRTSP